MNREDQFITQKKSGGFSEIVLGHISKILEITRTTNPDKNMVIRAYTTAVKSFSDILISYYDDEMQGDYEKFEKAMKALKKSESLKSLYFVKAFRIHRQLFRDLNRLLGRKQFLKAEIYAESEDDEEKEID